MKQNRLSLTKDFQSQTLEKKAVRLYLAVLALIILIHSLFFFLNNLNIFEKIAIASFGLCLIGFGLCYQKIVGIKFCRYWVEIIYVYYLASIYIYMGTYVSIANAEIPVLGISYSYTALPLLAAVIPMGTLSFIDFRNITYLIWLQCYYILILTPIVTLKIFIDDSIPNFLRVYDSFSDDTLGVFFICNVSLFTLALFMILYYTQQKNQKIEKKIVSMVYDVMPSQLADKIIQRELENSLSEYYPQATLMIMDIVKFTEMCTKYSATEIVKFLNHFFGQLDDGVENIGLEKIKTAGDAYILGNGIYKPHDPNLVVNFALRLLEFNKTFFVPGIKEKLKFRTGIHTGNLYGGILGSQYNYDIWGDTFQYTDLICKLTRPGKISISETVKPLVEKNYVLRERKLTYQKKNFKIYEVQHIRPLSL